MSKFKTLISNVLVEFLHYKYKPMISKGPHNLHKVKRLQNVSRRQLKGRETITTVTTEPKLFLLSPSSSSYFPNLIYVLTKTKK